MTKGKLPERPRGKPQKRSGASLSNEESPSKKLARETERIDPANATNSGGCPERINSIPDSDDRGMSPIDLEQNRRSDTVMGDDFKMETPGSNEIVNPGLSVLGEHVTRLINLITTLRDNGIERLAVDLPQIVVVGDQSTGKSSLIEGLSAIKVPRNEGTCTRCPIEINLKATESAWHCRISIVKKYGYDVPQDQANPSLGLGLYNKELSPASIEPFADITDKSAIPIWLARAQLAVLNPARSIKMFAVPLHQDLEITTMHEHFSPNVIRLEICAPKLPSLSFFDLPGVIVQDSEPHVPAMIRKLVKSYIAPSKSLVLLTLPVDNDRANSQAAGLVSEAKAEDRTIGIISKPDRLVAANVQQWKEILSGEKFPLKLGYRVVKNPADPNVDHTEARRQERFFFETDLHFCGPLGMFQDRFGTEQLQEFLSKHLVTMIKNCLPEIERKVKDRERNIEEELRKLPKLPGGNVCYEMQQRLTDFERQLTAIISNSVDVNTGSGSFHYAEGVKWFQVWHKEAQAFFEKLAKSAPRLDMSEPPKASPPATIGRKKTTQVSDAIEVESDSEPLPQPARQTSSGQISFTSKQQSEINAVVGKFTKKFTLAQLRSKLHAVNGGVYGIGDPRVFEQLLKECIGHWTTILDQFLQFTAKACRKLVVELLDLRFANLKKTQLLRVIQISAGSFIDKLQKKQTNMSTRLLDIEVGKPLTLDHYEQEKVKQGIMKKLRDQYHQAEARKRMKIRIEAGMKVSNADERRILEEVQDAPNQPNQELNELAGTIAYYKIAARRFADYNCLVIRNELFHTMITGIVFKVGNDIGLGPETDIGVANDELRRLMVPSSQDVNRRKELEGELALLEQTEKAVVEALDMDKAVDSDEWQGSDEG